MSNFAIFKDSKTAGTNGPAETTSYATRTNLTQIYNDLNITITTGAMTFGTTGIYAIRVRAQHFGPAGRRFVHRIHKNGTATGLPSTPCITDVVSNWVSISFNILSLTVSDVITVKSKTDTTASTFAGKAANVTNEVYTEVEVEKLTASNGALFYYSKAANTAGDNEVITYTARDLTSSVNNITSLSESSGIITFPVGNFRIRTLCTHEGGAGRRFVHYFNGASTGAIASSVSTNLITESISFLNVATGTTALTFKSKVDAVTATPTMGKVGNLGEIEIYGLVDIVKF